MAVSFSEPWGKATLIDDHIELTLEQNNGSNSRSGYVILTDKSTTIEYARTQITQGGNYYL
jgi:hypothetical protein